MEKVSIIGCGWLGFNLAQALLKEGYDVLGSTTTEGKTEALAKAGITPFLFRLEPMPTGNSFQVLFSSATLIINIPPASRKNPSAYYREQIKYLKYLLQGNQEVKRVIFISSTSFYPNVDHSVDENTPFDIEKGSNQAVVWAEQEISEIQQDLVILRCGGLMGDDRIPGRYFAGKATNGKLNPTNYIHRDDVIREIKGLLQTKAWPNIKNLVHPAHYTREEIMTVMAKKYAFDAPLWEEPHHQSTKIVNSIHDLGQLIDPLTY